MAVTSELGSMQECVKGNRRMIALILLHFYLTVYTPFILFLISFLFSSSLIPLQTVDAEAEGVTYEGENFIVPRTADTLEAFIHPKHWSIIPILVAIPALFMAYLSFVIKVPMYINILHVMFTRSAYNAGLGYLLNVQSKEKRITKWYKYYTTNKDSLIARILLYFVRANLPEGRSPDEFPAAFNAWVMYKGLVSKSN